MGEDDLAYRDELTGGYNRRYLTHLFEVAWDELRQEHPRLSIIMVDLDSMKEINDTYGHSAGDGALRETVALLQEQFREDDILVRYGGDEFVLLLPGVGREEAASLAERARRAGAHRRLTLTANGREVKLPIPFSVGVASSPEDGWRGEQLIEVADERLYEDKRRRHDAERRRRIVPMLAAGLVLVALSFLAAEYLGSPGHQTLSDGDVARQPGPREAQTEARQNSPDVELVLLEVAELHVQVRELTAQRQDESVAKARYEAKISNLEATIRRLETQLAQRESRETAVLQSESPPLGGAGEIQDRARAASLAPAETEPATVPGDDLPATEAPEAEVSTLESESAVPHPVASPPVAVHRPKPDYPAMAWRAWRLGLLRQSVVVVRVRVDVDAAGRVMEAEALGPAHGYGFEAAARQAALKTTFKPATLDSVPVAMATTMTYRFFSEVDP